MDRQRKTGSSGSLALTWPAAAASLSEQRGLEGESTSNVRGIEYPKLLLRWRGAQAVLSNSLNEISKDLLARKGDVIADSRFEDVKEMCHGAVAVAGADVWQRGSRMRSTRGINEGQGPRGQPSLPGKAVGIIDVYRQQNCGGGEAEATGGVRLRRSRQRACRLGGELDAALTELRGELTTVI